MTNRFQIIKESFNTVISKKFYVPILYTIFGIFFICVIGSFFTRDLELWIDIGIGDEAKYLGDGINFLRTRPDASWGPLYSLWYYSLSLFSTDNIDLYYLNYRFFFIHEQ